MGMKKPFVLEIAKNTYAINEFGLVTMYLLVGEESALLIDTGCGACDLKGLVAELTDKPYQVVLTHGHLDHSGGVEAFDEVYLGEGDFKMIRDLDFSDLEMNFEVMVNYLDLQGKRGSYEVYDYTPDCIHPFERIPKLTAVHDGDIFDLGNRKVEVIEVPGHSPGGICLLDETSGILFSGDACNINLIVAGCSANTALRGLDHLKEYDGRYKQMFNGHIGYAGAPTCFSQPETVLDDCIHILECVLNHTDTPDVGDFLWEKRIGMNYGSARVSYNPNRLSDEGEKPVR